MAGKKMGRPRREKQRSDVAIPLRVTPKERTVLNRAAKAAHVSREEFIRSAALRAARRKLGR